MQQKNQRAIETNSFIAEGKKVMIKAVELNVKVI